jgi:hypothetical protein
MLAFVCIFCSLLSSALYGLAGAPGGFPAVLELVAAYLFPASIALWVRSDAAKRHQDVPYDFDSLVFLFWPIAAPVYLLRTRGWSGCGPIILFVVLSLVAVLLESVLVYYRFPGR